MLEALLDIDLVKKQATAKLDQSRRGELGQFLTPSKLASFMASLFLPNHGEVHLLEAGAGVGSLIAAFLDKAEIQNEVGITAYEIDPILLPYLSNIIRAYTDRFRAEGRNIQSCILGDDFILAGSKLVIAGHRPYTHAILNPPYKKINSKSQHRKILSAIGQEHVNLYTAFISLALAQLKQGGQLVAIVPRSFCNGLYYKPFRNYILGKASLNRLHLFASRTKAFEEDDVLQENIILHLTRGAEQADVIISQSSDHSLLDMKEEAFAFDKILKPNDPERFIYVPHLEAGLGLADSSKAHFTLKDLGLEVSTGPIVDFRVKEFLRKNPEQGSVPLLYPMHFNCKEMDWPKQGRKPNSIMVNAETEKSLWPSGFYTAVKRFSSKEEKQRIVARVINPNQIDATSIGLENHLNIFHSKKHGIDGLLAYGLAAYLNCTIVDQYFRSFNGHTQVNATDLKRLRYPSRASLIQLGAEAQELTDFQPSTLDSLVSKYL